MVSQPTYKTKKLDKAYCYISFDPGLTTGIACWNKKAELIRTADMDQDELDKFLRSLETELPLEFIIEEYRVYAHVNHIGSKVETIQVIGGLKQFARRNGIQVTEQPASIKGIAALWSGIKVPKGHMPDWMAAVLHGYYYLHYVKQLIKARVWEENGIGTAK